MKKSLLFLCLLGVISFTGCAKENNAVSNNQSEILSEKEQKAIQEELDAIENAKTFDITGGEMSEEFKKDDSLIFIEEDGLCIFQDKDKRFEFQLGDANEKIPTIYYDIYNKSPLEDDKLYEDFYKIVEKIFSKLDTELDKDKIDAEFLKVKDVNDQISFKYSDKITLFIGKVGKNFDFRIYPFKEEEF